jgi:hypothetical protein
MDFVNFAAVEVVGAIEAQRAFERRERKWLRAWRQLGQTGVTPAEIRPLVITPVTTDDVPAKRAA